MKSFQVFLIAIFLSTAAVAQVPSRGVSDQMDYYGNPLPMKTTIPYDEVKGSPYHNEKLRRATIVLSDGDTLIRYMRYNAYTDEMEYVQNNKIMALSNPEEVDAVLLNELVYRSRSYITQREVKRGFFIELVDGDASLFRHDLVEYKAAENPKTSYHQPVPARFESIKPVYYYSRQSAILKEFYNTHYVLSDLFRSDQDTFLRYIQDEKLKLRKEEDLVQLFKYMNSIGGTYD